MSWDNYIREGIAAVGGRDFARAEKSLKDALQFAKQNFSRSDSRLALTLSLLGHLYFHNEDFARAELLLEQSLKLHGAMSWCNEPCLLMDLYSLAEVKKASGKPGEACALYDETINRLKQQKTQEAAVVKQALGQFEKLLQTAKSQLRDVPAAQVEQPAGTVCGGADEAPAAPQTPVSAMASIATLTELWQQQLQKGLQALNADDEDERESLISAYLNLESALRVAKTIFRPADLRVINNLRALADASAKLRMHSQAEALYLEAIELAHSADDNAQPTLSALRLNLALVYVESDRLRKAKAIFDDQQVPDGLSNNSMVALTKRVERAYSLIRVYESVEELLAQAQLAEEAGDLVSANRLVNNALSLLKQGFRPNHPEHARLFRYRANVLTKLGNAEQAAELIERAERIDRANESALNDWSRATEELPRPMLAETMLSTTAS